MTYIVLDMEWNQPPIGKRPAMVPFALASEIMEFGAVKLDDDFRPGEEYKAFVHPSFYAKVHPYVKRITGIDEKTLREAPFFPDAMKLFLDFCGEDFAFITWGPDDVPALCDNLLAHGFDTDVIPPTFDLQHIFNSQITHNANQVSLSGACDILGIERLLPEHDALSDAYHTALICASLDMTRGIAEYGRDTRPARNYTHPQRKAKSRYPRPLAKINLDGTDDILSGDDGTYLACPLCGQRRLIEYRRSDADTYFSAFTCPEHGDFFARLVTDGVRGAGSGYIYGMTPHLRNIYKGANAKAKIVRKQKEKELV